MPPPLPTTSAACAAAMAVGRRGSVVLKPEQVAPTAAFGHCRGRRPLHCELRTSGVEWAVTDETLGTQSSYGDAGWVGLQK